ncbi:hypothetical protein LCGC14_1500280 [marine sediment metagenome]|uniref:Uncharacterized protein n=1 Tax=marine sediment metagenome TaxID=412755 RepID=A0A0F9LJY9_9ZZZZ
MKHELWYSVVVRNRHGKVLSRERRRGRSFLKQWNQLVYAHMMQVYSLSGVLDTGGTPRAISDHDNGFWMAQGGAGTTYGLRVGTGSTPVAIDDYALETPIGQGVGAGQMEHQACTVAISVVSAPSCYFVVSRTITNNSGDSITVREAALYMRAASSYYLCGARDVFGTPQVVPNGGSITVDWTLQVTV